ncbi:MAG: hypothetical protein ABI886_13095, partial [Betaproteobacteria bacterium]
MTTIRPLLAALFLAAPILLTACASQQATPADAANAPSARTTALRNPGPIPPAQLEAAQKMPLSAADAAAAAADRAKIFKGTGVVVKGQTPGGGLPPGPAVTQAGGGVVLNF